MTGNCEYRTCPEDYPEGEECAERERVANTSVPCFVEFRDAFSEFTADDCVGPGADAYRASVDLYGEDEAGRPAAVVTPADAAGCVAEQVCIGDPEDSSRRRPTAAMRTNPSVRSATRRVSATTPQRRRDATFRH